MATGDKEKSAAASDPSQSQFNDLIKAIREIGTRANFRTVVEPQPLDDNALNAVEDYAEISASLRTVFESIPSTRTASTF